MPQLGVQQPLPLLVDTSRIIERSRGTSLQEIQNTGMYGRPTGISGLTGLATGQSVQAIKSASGTFSIDVPNELMLVGAATAPLTGVGIFLGLDSPDYEFRVGNPAANYLHWNGTTLTVVGSVTATSGTIGGWTISSSELSSGNVKLQSTAERILLGSATAPLTGTGIFIGKDGSDYELRAGNPAGDYIHFDGTTFTINTNTFTGSNPIFTNSVTVRSGQGATRHAFEVTAGNAVYTLYASDSTAAGTIGAGTSGLLAITGTTNLNLLASTSVQVGNVFRPTVNDIAALGTATLSFSDLFLASGAVINFNNGNVVLTHSAGVLTMGTGKLTVGTAPTYTPTNVTTDRAYNANATSLDELADVVGTMIADLQTIGLFQ